MDQSLLAAVIAELAAIADVPVDRMNAGTYLAALGIDSLQALQLLVACEQTLGIPMTEQDLVQFTTIGSVVELLESHRDTPATA